MLRRIITAGLFMVLAAMFTFVGCSDDSNPSNSNIGDPNSVAFQPMKAAITSAVDSTLGVALRFAFRPNHFPNDLVVDRPGLELGPGDSLLYNYVEGWHILFLGLTASVDYNRTFVDSVRYWEGSTVVQRLSFSRVTGLDLIHHNSTTYKGTDGEYTDRDIYSDLSFRNLRQSSQYFYGYASVVLDDYYVESDHQYNTNYDFNLTANDVTFTLSPTSPWSNSYVTGGQLLISAAVDNNTDLVEWEIDVTFDETGQAQVEATDGSKTYSFSITPQYR